MPSRRPQPQNEPPARPQTVRPAATRPFDGEDPNALVPAADPIVQAAYARSTNGLPILSASATGFLPMPPMGEESPSDALVIRREAKDARVVSFRAEGVHWKAGFAPEPALTPLGQHLAGAPFPAGELKAGTGFSIRRTDTALEAVLRDILPGTLKAAEASRFGKARAPLGVYVYYLPHGTGAAVGACVVYDVGPGARAHLVYLQTDVKRADQRVLLELEQTFRAALAMRGAARPARAEAFDFWGEIRQASLEFEAELRASPLLKRTEEAGREWRAARARAEYGLDRALRGALGGIGNGLAFVLVSLPQRLVAGLVRGASGIAVGLLRATRPR